jgi:hypothetical protein
MINGPCVGITVSGIPELQLVLNTLRRANQAIDILMDTGGFYRLFHQ